MATTLQDLEKRASAAADFTGWETVRRSYDITAYNAIGAAGADARSLYDAACTVFESLPPRVVLDAGCACVEGWREAYRARYAINGCWSDTVAAVYDTEGRVATLTTPTSGRTLFLAWNDDELMTLVINFTIDGRGSIGAAHKVIRAARDLQLYAETTRPTPEQALELYKDAGRGLSRADFEAWGILDEDVAADFIHAATSPSRYASALRSMRFQSDSPGSVLSLVERLGYDLSAFEVDTYPGGVEDLAFDLLCARLGRRLTLTSQGEGVYEVQEVTEDR